MRKRSGQGRSRRPGRPRGGGSRERPAAQCARGARRGGLFRCSRRGGSRVRPAAQRAGWSDRRTLPRGARPRHRASNFVLSRQKDGFVAIVVSCRRNERRVPGGCRQAPCAPARIEGRSVGGVRHRRRAALDFTGPVRLRTGRAPGSWAACPPRPPVTARPGTPSLPRDTDATPLRRPPRDNVPPRASAGPRGGAGRGGAGNVQSQRAGGVLGRHAALIQTRTVPRFAEPRPQQE